MKHITFLFVFGIILAVLGFFVGVGPKVAPNWLDFGIRVYSLIPLSLGIICVAASFKRTTGDER